MSKNASCILRKGVFFFAGFAVLLTGCGRNKVEKEFEIFLKQHVATVEPLYQEANLAYWEATASGKDEAYKRSADLQLKLKKVYANREEFEKIKQWKESGKIKDPLLKRQLTILYNEYLGAQIDTALMRQIVELSSEVEKKFNTFRGEINGKKVTTNDIYQILAESKDSRLRRKAWEAQKSVGEQVADDVRKLAHLRNQAARSLGFSDYFEMSMKLAEQDPDEILRLLDDLACQTDELFRQRKHEIDSVLAKRYGIAEGEMMPWHYHDPFFQEKPQIFDVNFDEFYSKHDIKELAIRFYSGIGLDVKDILARSDLYEREGKYPHAYCTDIDRKGDVRIMVNLRNNENWMNTLLHELGHAVYAKYIDRDLPFLLRTEAHIFTTEAIAEMFGSLAYSAAWMRDMGLIGEEDYGRLAPLAEKGIRLSNLVFARWVMVMVHFERELYRNPAQDLNSLWWQLKERYQYLRKPAGRNKPDWAAKIHIAAYPVYYHNYLLGYLMAAQLRHAMMRDKQVENPLQWSMVGDRKVGEFLREKVFAPGARYRWDELIRRATGEDLTPRYFVNEL